MNKVIIIKTNRLTLGILVLILVFCVVLYMTNGIQNLFFAGITPGSIDTVTVYYQGGDRQAQLTKEDTQALASLLRKVSLRGDSVRLRTEETFGPQYRVKLRTGITFTISCYDSHYIVNGRAYPFSALSENNFRALYDLYFAHMSNREYFPRERGADNG